MKLTFKARKTEIGIARISFYTDAGAIPNRLILLNEEWDIIRDILKMGHNQLGVNTSVELEIEEL